MMYRVWFKLLSMVAILSMVLSSACTQEQTQQAKPSDEPKQGGTLTIAESQDPVSLDPHTQVDWVALEFAQQVYNGLIHFAPSTSALQIVPDLAERWEQPDPLTYIFYLRKGVKFQNVPPVNGRELTSEDVKYSFERIATNKPNFVRRYTMEAIDKIETPDKYTVKITTKEPTASFLNYVANAWSVIVPKELVDRDGDLGKAAIGTGPFILDNYTRNVSATFKRNPDYFEKGKPYLDSVKILIIPDQSTRMAALRANQVDIGIVISTDLDSFKQTNPNAIIDQVPSWGALRIHFGLAKPPFNDVRVRQAVQLAIDKDEMVKLVANGQAKASVGAIPWAYTQAALPPSEAVKVDREKAKKLLADAGYPNGLKVELMAFNLTETAAPVIKDQLKQIGIDAEIKLLELGAYFKRKYAFDYELAAHTSAPYDDPEEYLLPYFGSKATYYNYKNPKIDELLDKQHRTMDQAERIKILQEAQRLIVQEAAEINVYSVWSFVAHYPYVKGYVPSSTYYYRRENIWLDK